MQANQFRTAEARGVEAVVAAMARFPHQTTVQLSALLAFIPLALENIMMQVTAPTALASVPCPCPSCPCQCALSLHPLPLSEHWCCSCHSTSCSCQCTLSAHLVTVSCQHILSLHLVNASTAFVSPPNASQSIKCSCQCTRLLSTRHQWLCWCMDCCESKGLVQQA